MSTNNYLKRSSNIILTFVFVIRLQKKQDKSQTESLLKKMFQSTLFEMPFWHFNFIPALIPS